MSQVEDRTSESVQTAYFGPDADRRFALDRAHRGDINGALGSVSCLDTGPRRGTVRRLATLAAIAGPGLIVLVANNDASGVSIYAQAGKIYGLRMVAVVVVLAIVLYVTQEMAARIGAVTGVGHARLICERFGRRWGSFALADLLLLNLLTLVIDFVGVRFSLGLLGVSHFISVPLAAAFLIAAVASGSFRRWERVMYTCIIASLVCIPLVIFSDPDTGAAGTARLFAGTEHATNSIFFVIALVGSTVAPWQIFLHQSNVVDKRITTRWLNYERVDLLGGSLLFVVGTLGVLMAFSFAFQGTHFHGVVANAGVLGHQLWALDGPIEGALFAVLLLNSSILGASAVTLATSYAIGDFFGLRHSLHRSWRRAPIFHATFAACVILAGATVLVPGIPLGLLTIAVQALSGTLLPSASILLLLLCNDGAILGPHTNSAWLNALATAVVGSMLVLSLLVSLTTLLPHLRLVPTEFALGGCVAIVLVGLAICSARRASVAALPVDTAAIWTMPPLETLAAPESSKTRIYGLAILRGYLVIATVLLVVKIVDIALAST